MRSRAHIVLLLSAFGCGRSAHSEDASETHGRRPGVPQMIAPASGSYTGVSYGATRPTFVWAPVKDERAIAYEVQVDDSCKPGSIETCGFGSPAIDTRTREASFRPDAPLPVGERQPVGLRYYFRVRACAGHLCSPWTRIRYVDVGRARGDFDGDGFSDIAVGAPLVDSGGRDRGAAFIYYGTPMGVGRQTRLIDPLADDDAAFGVAVSVAGDVNADGYADLLIGAAGSSEARGRAYVFLGSAKGLQQVGLREIRLPGGEVDDWFGSAVSGAGDVDGDGYADVLVGASGKNRQGADWGVAYVFRGAPGGVRSDDSVQLTVSSSSNYDHFGFTVAGAGDLDGDGYADVAVGSPGIDQAGDRTGTDRGAVYVFRGSAVGVLETAAQRLEAPVPLDFDRFGYAVAAAGDIDADGYEDLLIGAPGRDDPDFDGGTAYFYRGSADGVHEVPDRVLQDPRADILDRMGTSVSGAGDLNGDGFDDIVVGTAGANRGRALVYYGSREGIPPRPGLFVEDPLGPGYNEFASSVAGAGDVNADGVDDLVIGASGADNGGDFRGSIVLYAGTRNGLATAKPLRRDDPAGGERDHFGHVVTGR